MHTIDIFRGNAIFTTIKPDDASVQAKKIMAENELRVSFKLDHYANFLINDYCTVFSEKYKLNQPPVVRKLSTYLYEYSMILQAEGFDLAKAQFLFPGLDNNLTESDFSLMGNAETFIDLILQNINRISNGWTKGQVIPTAYKNIDFTTENCYNALSRLAEEFETEFWIDGKIIHLTKMSVDTGYTFKHGRNKGLYELTRQNINNSNIATRIYAYGSEKNLPADYRNGSRRLKMPDDFVQQYTDFYGVIEHTEIFDDIYPHRTGVITSVNILDIYKFIDTTIDFNVNDQLLPGITAKIIFNTGQLAGYQFEISSFNNGAKEFTILKNKEEKVLDLPNADLKPAIGDEYVLVDINMPAEYVNAAEEELLAKATQLLARVSTPQVAYQLVIDPVFLKKSGYSINIGGKVWIVDDAIGIHSQIRIVGTIRNLTNEYQYQVELSDSVSPTTINRIINNQVATDRNVRGIASDLQNNQLLNGNAIGNFTIKQGTMIIEDIPETPTAVGFSDILIENSTGRIFKKI